MLKKISDYIQKYHMIENGDTIVAGISGGADSVCLLFVLFEMQKQIPFTIEVVHINHGIREEAAEDARFVEELCRQQGILFHVVEVDIKEMVRQSGRSEEEEGRMVRYEAFEKVLGGRRGKIAVAHNSNDRAETMLFHLFRGTGLAGASGIPPVNGRIIRPLLCVERKEIEAWLSEQNLTFCTDATNAQDIYTRNRIRHHILNYAEENICQGVVSNMSRAADQLLNAEEYLVRQTLEAAGRCVTSNTARRGEEVVQGITIKDGDKIVIRIPEFLKEDKYLQGRILHLCLEQAAGSKKDLTAVHVNSVRELLVKQGNGEVHLPYGLVVYKKYDLGMIERRVSDYAAEKDSKSNENAVKMTESEREKYVFKLPVENEVVRFGIPELGVVEITAFCKKDSQNIPQKSYTKWFDYDKITKSVVLRTKQPGDYLTINREMGRKSLQDYFVNEKIPREERNQKYLLADESHIIWVVGYRISEYYKVTEETKRILQIKISDNISKEERSHSNG